MPARRRIVTLALLGCLAVLFPLLPAAPALAHGSLQSPASRAYTCYLEGPESPDSAACRAAIAAGGAQPIYDWPEVNLADAAGQHRQRIPDGKLCSAGRDKYRGLDLPRADWPATTLPTAGSFTLTFLPTVAHRGSFQFYVTRAGYDPTQPLRWADLEPTPFATISDPTAYRVTATVPPGRQGRHLIYTIWQRSDSPEAFYACSDVSFGAQPPPPPPACAEPWHPAVTDLAGDRASHRGRLWQARYWTRGDEPGLGDPQWGPWADLGACPAAATAAAARPMTCALPHPRVA